MQFSMISHILSIENSFSLRSFIINNFSFYIIIIILENKEYHKMVNVGKRRHVDIRRFFHQMQKRRIEEPYPAIF